MMTGKDAKLTSDRLRQELAEIDELEAQLLKAFAERTATPARIGELFQSLYRRTTAHLSDEERGVLHDAAEASPDLKEKCAKLCEDHASLRNQLEALMKMVTDASCTPEWWDQIECDFKQFSLELTRHDEKERRLIDDIEQNRT